MKYEYFVSFAYANKDKGFGHGNNVLKCDEKINKAKDIGEMEKMMIENFYHDRVVITNFILLNETEG